MTGRTQPSSHGPEPPRRDRPEPPRRDRPEPPRRDDVPAGIDPFGIPREGAGRDAFVMTLALCLALLGLIFTLGYAVFHSLGG
jgi:hypothetical protein